MAQLLGSSADLNLFGNATGDESDNDPSSWFGFIGDGAIPEAELEPTEVEGEATTLAKGWIEAFFADKEMYYGGPISDKILYSPRYIDMVLNTQIILAIEVVYASMVIAERCPKQDKKIGGIESDVGWVLKTLNMCAKFRVPPCLIGGIMLMYLELCEGIDIPKGLLD